MKRTDSLLVLIAVLAAAPLEAQTAPPVPDTSRVARRLRPGDVINVWIWREKDISGDYPVPESGIVVLPKIGPRSVMNAEPIALRDSIIAEFRKYLNNPAIEIRFGRRITILGAVREPGLYAVDETMTIAEALAKAGGTMPDGQSDEIRLHRSDQVLVAKITQRTRIADLPLQSGDQLFVPERSWFARNSGIVAALISGVVSVSIALLVQR